MPNWIYSLLDFVFVLFLCFTIFYSIRYRKQSEPVRRNLTMAKMNIAMGITIADIAVIQFTSADVLHLIIGAVFALLGLYNLFAGIRNYRRIKKPA